MHYTEIPSENKKCQHEENVQVTQTIYSEGKTMSKEGTQPYTKAAYGRWKSGAPETDKVDRNL